MIKVSQESNPDRATVLKKFGLFWFLLFLTKGVLWLLVPTMLAYLNIN